MSTIDEVRQKIQPEFASQEEFYAYAADNPSVKISVEEARAAIEENLLPVFKVAKELCEHLSGDKDYFKKDRHTKHLYHMALVSRMIKNINDYSGTPEEKKKALHLSAPHYGGLVYIKDGKKTQEQSPFVRKEDRGFKNLIAKAGIGCSAYDDQLTTIYFAAFREDVSPIFSENAKALVSGRFLHWQAAKDSAVLQIADKPLIEAKMAQIAKEKGISFAKRYECYQDAEAQIQAKIDQFCDMKQAGIMTKTKMEGR